MGCRDLNDLYFLEKRLELMSKNSRIASNPKPPGKLIVLNFTGGISDYAGLGFRQTMDN